MLVQIVMLLFVSSFAMEIQNLCPLGLIQLVTGWVGLWKVSGLSLSKCKISTCQKMKKKRANETLN